MHRFKFTHNKYRYALPRSGKFFPQTEASKCENACFNKSAKLEVLDEAYNSKLVVMSFLKFRVKFVAIRLIVCHNLCERNDWFSLIDDVVSLNVCYLQHSPCFRRANTSSLSLIFCSTSLPFTSLAKPRGVCSTARARIVIRPSVVAVTPAVPCHLMDRLSAVGWCL